MCKVVATQLKFINFKIPSKNFEIQISIHLKPHGKQFKKGW